MTCETHGNLTICRPTGCFIGQVRRTGFRKWETVTMKHASAERALACAIRRMTREHKRARVLFLDASGYYEPNLMMEARRL